MATPVFCIEFHDTAPDAFGRRTFTLTWRTDGPIHGDPKRPHIHTGWGPVLRGQVFRTDPARFTRGGRR